MKMAKHARSGQGRVSKSSQARGGDVVNKAGGVPSAEKGNMGDFARQGNASMIPKIVSVQTGLSAHGPAVVAAVARMGGQVGLAPGQFKVWAHPTHDAPKPSKQV